MDPLDLRVLLDAWPFHPDHDARIVRMPDRRDVLQVRLPLGIEQHELEGRPDGARPHGKESFLEHHLERLAKARERGQAKHFTLSPEECAVLFDEGTQFYYRYLRLFQLKEWFLTERDTARNLRLFDFVHHYAAREQDQQYLERWRPYLLRMNAIARAMIELSQQDYTKAQQIIRDTIREIEELPEMEDDMFKFENRRSLAALKDLTAQIEQTKPLNEIERLEKELQHAVAAQEFERAARLRDRLRALRARP